MKKVRRSPVILGTCAVIALCTAAQGSGLQLTAGQPASHAPPPEPAEAQISLDAEAAEPISQLRRVIRHFDFEERTRQPYDFPVGWYRIGPSGPAAQPDSAGFDRHRPGHPLFGRMTFSDTGAKSGRWSFQFELEGGSMTAALAPGAVPIIPGGRYLVTVWIRTEGLHHAAARAAAVFYDQHRRPIRASRVESELIRSDGGWRQIAIEIGGPHPNAADLGVELQLLQPAQHRAGRREPFEPIHEDTSGRVWFDDVIVWHLPQIDLSTGSPGNIIMAPQSPRLRVGVRDLASEPIEAQLAIHDLSGRSVYADTIGIERGRIDHIVDLPKLPYGWYRATVELSNERQTLGSYRLDFAHVPPDLESVSTGGVSSESPVAGVNLETIDLDLVSRSAVLVGNLEIPLAALPAWDRTHSPARSTSADGMEAAIQRYLDDGGELVFVLPEIPDELALQMHLDRMQVLEMFRGDEQMLRRYLQDLLITFGQRVDRWQIGTTERSGLVANDDPAAALEQSRRVLARLVPGPEVVVPWSAEHAPIAVGADMPLHIRIPHEVRPQAINEHVRFFDRDPRDLLVTLEPLPAGRFEPRQRAVDLAFRALFAWRSGAGSILMPQPWMKSAHDDAEVEPDAVLAAWLQVARALGGRRFAGEVPIGRGMQCWMFDGRDDSILVAWNETASFTEAVLEAKLAVGKIRVVDLQGNPQDAPLSAAGRHRIPLSQEPVFILGVDPALARFRQGFRIEPDFAVSAPREHTAEIVLHNPWSTAVGGTLRFTDPAGWNFTPAELPFSMAPGEEIRLPFAVQFGRAETAGPRRVGAVIDIATDQRMSFEMSADFEIGLPGIRIEPTWRPAGDDIVLSAFITNTGDRTLALEIIVLAPDYPRMRRPVAQLQPGETVLKSFHLQSGGETLAGRTVRISVSEIGSSDRLNAEMTIAPLRAGAAVSAPDGR